MLTLVENLLVVCTGVVHQKLVPNSRMKNFQILLPVDTKSYIKTSVADPDLHESGIIVPDPDPAKNERADK